MDINILNSGTPSSKNWLNPVCNVITCNQLITPVNVFNMYNTNLLALVSPLTNPCDTIGIANPNLNIANNQYTAPVDCFILVNYSLIIYYVATSLSIGCSLNVTINGINTYLFTQLTKAAGSDIGPFPLTANGVLKLNAGDILGFNLSTSGNLANTLYGNVSFSGTIL